MATTYRLEVRTGHGQGAVAIDVPDGAEPLPFLANEIARELGLTRFEVQVGEHGGSIRRLGDNGPGTPFSLTLLEPKD